MRFTHVGTVFVPGSSPVQITPCSPMSDATGDDPMFVRAVWRLKRLVNVKQTLREMEVPTTRDALGLSGTDFQKMTRGLFDR
jgi:hypothetical protein